MAATIINRRTFLKLSTYTAAALAISLSNGCSNRTIDAAAVPPLFFSHLVDVKMILDTGKAYLAKFPAENHQDKLTDLLQNNHSFTGTQDAAAIRSYLNSEVENDFKTGKVVMVNGWVLSVTEARQCALLSLLHQ